MHHFKILLPLIAAALLSLLNSSCIKEPYYLVDNSARLAFSQDTVTFDTVFATMGTATRHVKVYNNYDDAIMLNAVTLLHGKMSRFRINVDGDTSFTAHDVEIAAHDSIFIFIQANINPNDQLSPYLVTDSIVFTFNNHSQFLPLTAYGRNAVYHLPTHWAYSTYDNEYKVKDTLWYHYSVIDCQNWDHTRPHVIIGFAVVDSLDVLHLSSGDELYFGTDSYLWVYDGGTLDVRGSRERPVLFTSIRHDGYYDTLPGQWGYIWLSLGSRQNYIDFARIENGTAGIVADTNVDGLPTLTISNSVIENHSYSGIIGQGSYIVGDNLLVDNCGMTLLSLQYGGRYRFSNSTFANYWRYGSRSLPSVVLNNHYDYDASTVFPRDLVEASFDNCIIYGTYLGNDSTGEVLLDYNDGAQFNFFFHYCLLRTYSIDSTEVPQWHTSFNRDPLFVDTRCRDFHLGEESPARSTGDPAQSSTVDLDGNLRSYPPSMGAYEYRPVETTKRSSYKRNHNNNTINHQQCTTTSADLSTRSLRPTRSSTATGWATFLKSPSTHIHR